MPQFVSFLECLFQTIAARLGDKVSLEVLCYWSIQFKSLLTVMSEVCDKAVLYFKDSGDDKCLSKYLTIEDYQSTVVMSPVNSFSDNSSTNLFSPSMRKPEFMFCDDQ